MRFWQGAAPTLEDLRGYDMTKSLANITLTPRRHTHGLWYIEIIRPGIVAEQVGDFESKAAAEDWIGQNAKSYFSLHLGDEECDQRREGKPLQGKPARPA